MCTSLDLRSSICILYPLWAARKMVGKRRKIHKYYRVIYWLADKMLELCKKVNQVYINDKWTMKSINNGSLIWLISHIRNRMQRVAKWIYLAHWSRLDQWNVTTTQCWTVKYYSVGGQKDTNFMHIARVRTGDDDLSIIAFNNRYFKLHLL